MYDCIYLFMFLFFYINLYISNCYKREQGESPHRVTVACGDTVTSSMRMNGPFFKAKSNTKEEAGCKSKLYQT